MTCCRQSLTSYVYYEMFQAMIDMVMTYSAQTKTCADHNIFHTFELAYKHSIVCSRYPTICSSQSMVCYVFGTSIW